MLDVHPPHQAAHSWKDFFIHIATICVGLLIAIGLEQTVEAIHHHHQREYLVEQMRAESERNLVLVKAQIGYAADRIRYLDARQQALETAPRSGDHVLVFLPPNSATLPGGFLVSPSRGTWEVAKSSGMIALLPPESAKVYARLDLDAEFEQAAESATFDKASALQSARLRVHIPLDATSPVSITPEQRDDLIFANNEYRNSIADLQLRLALMEGALEAVLDNIRFLEEMYPYQERALTRSGAGNIQSRHQT